MTFDPGKEYEFSVKIRDVDSDEAEKLVGPAYTELYCWLSLKGASLRAAGIDPEAETCTEGRIAASLNKYSMPAGVGKWDEQAVHAGLMALGDAGLIEFLYLGRKGEFDEQFKNSLPPSSESGNDE
jgi:hypothetical protein